MRLTLVGCLISSSLFTLFRVKISKVCVCACLCKLIFILSVKFTTTVKKRWERESERRTITVWAVKRRISIKEISWPSSSSSSLSSCRFFLCAWKCCGESGGWSGPSSSSAAHSSYCRLLSAPRWVQFTDQLMLSVKQNKQSLIRLSRNSFNSWAEKNQ